MTRTALRALLFVALGATLLRAQAPAPPMPAGTNVLLGRVLEVGTDAPVGGAMVTLIGHFDASGKPAALSPIVGREVPPTLNVMTTADGYFVFRNLPAGSLHGRHARARLPEQRLPTHGRRDPRQPEADRAAAPGLEVRDDRRTRRR